MTENHVKEKMGEKKARVVHKMEKNEKSECVSLSTMIEEGMNEALDYNWWVDSDNVETTKNVYSHFSPFPVSLVEPNILQYTKESYFSQKRVSETDVRNSFLKFQV